MQAIPYARPGAAAKRAAGGGVQTPLAERLPLLMHSPAIAPSFLAMSDSLRHQNALPPLLRELAELGVCHAYRAPYAAHHHARRARLEGLSEAAIAAARDEAGPGGVGEQEAQVLEWTDALLARRRLEGAQRMAALSRFSPRQLADLVFTVGLFQLVCNFLNTFDVAVEAEHA